MANIKVAVRVRPISEREQCQTGAEVVVRADKAAISLTNLKVPISKAGDSRERTKRYGFDFCFDSSNPESEDYASQETVYRSIGLSVLESLFKGYNCCLVVYGQSASGKTYTMMGPKDDSGLTPRLCEGLFLKMSEGREKKDATYRIAISYLEVYNERVRDLLRTPQGASSSSGLRVREHPKLGPYVQGLTQHVVDDLSSLMSYVEEGTRARKTAATQQNPTSSRSHSLITISLWPVSKDQQMQGVAPVLERSGQQPRCRKLHLVDLAGSESAATCTGIHRLKEGANINKSLVALGNVISALAERGATGSGPGRRFIPYRDSALTWLLKDALGGNAATIVLATISPASGSYNETAHTLRFAQRAQSVVNRPVINEDPVARIIRELRAEVARLKSLLSEKNLDSDSGKREPCRCMRTLRNVEDQDQEDAQDTQDKNSSETGQFYSIRKCSSSESLDRSIESRNSIRRCGSLELVNSRGVLDLPRYGRARISELCYEEEVKGPVFVDIPTLVAVLIKPDDDPGEGRVQIEEICSDEVPEGSIDADFLESPEPAEVPASSSSSISRDEETLLQEKVDLEEDKELEERKYLEDPETHLEGSISGVGGVLEDRAELEPASSRVRPAFRKPRLSKQDSVDCVSSSRKETNLHASKKYGSVEALQKKREPISPVRKAQPVVDKQPRSPVAEKTKRLNNIREIEDPRSTRTSLWRALSSNKELKRKGSNDSDKSLRENGVFSSSKPKTLARKQSVEEIKRKTSKDSSSSSSREDPVLNSISSSREKLLQRKGSLDQESPSPRAHTPIQRLNRREIVAAVTERLYTTKKSSDETPSSTTANPQASSEIRSPESSDVKLAAATRMRLQEISRKMLARRRKICVDTQTDNRRTLRVKDTASLTDSPSILRREIGVLTDSHEDCGGLSGNASPVLRVKEMATLTERRRSAVRYKDVASITDERNGVLDQEEEDYERRSHSPRNDSGILSDDTQNYAESNLSSVEIVDSFTEARTDRRSVEFAESSTNTGIPGGRVFRDKGVRDEEGKCDHICSGRCCNRVHHECCRFKDVHSVGVDKSVISISLPDTISITIESPTLLESRIAVMENHDVGVDRSRGFKDAEVQTEESRKDPVDREILTEQGVGIFFKDFANGSKQTDGKPFRIENIFQDPRGGRSKSARSDVTTGLKSEEKSIIFTRSVGVSFVPETKDSSTDMENPEEGRLHFACTGSEEKISDTVRSDDRNRGWSLSPSKRMHSPLDSLPVPRDPSKLKSTIKPMSLIEAKIDDGLGERMITWTDPQVFLKTPLKENLVVVEVDGKATPLETDMVEVFAREHSFQNSSETSKTACHFTKMDSSDQDQNFSDDSLDLNEINLQFDHTVAKVVTEEASEETPCPPDVVAQTKKSSNAAEEAEVSILRDFDDNQVDFPRIKPTLNDTRVHDYESLILGACRALSVDAEDDDYKRRKSEPTESNASGTKKKVSFSNCYIFEEGQNCSESPKATTPKSIIKNANRKSVEVPKGLEEKAEESISGSMEGSEELEAEEKSKRGDRISKGEIDNLGEDREDVEHDAEDDDEDLPGASNVLAEYLDQAIAFMRNMNSINEYMSASKMLETCRMDHQHCNSDECDLDYIVCQGQRISLNDDIDISEDDEDALVISTESYENCLKSIKRLESCIGNIERHNRHLQEKYGVEVGSAGAKLGLAGTSPDRRKLENNASMFHRPPTPRKSPNSPRTRRSTVHPRIRCSEEVATTDSNKDEDRRRDQSMEDLEERIYQYLISASDPCKRVSRRKSRRGMKMSDFRVRNPGCYSKIRRRLEDRPENSTCSDLGESSQSVDDPFGEDRSAGTCADDSMGSVGVRCRKFPGSEVLENELEGLRTPSCSLRLSMPVAGVVKGLPCQTWKSWKNWKSCPRECLCRTESIYDSSSSSEAVAASVESLDGISGVRDKPRYPGSPKARFLQLLKERRRIVESSRSTGAS
ncbi:uncharacterized protein LOC105697219 [Orussus abietinus]|uniref:uncharacterized protein LOC105697219 n=1 Tax=Orussus abietinus TaxID=222816 RepID=UPI0006268055|nr:uncharacterized protein LOC105697219 [Orussus abietinus]